MAAAGAGGHGLSDELSAWAAYRAALLHAGDSEDFSPHLGLSRRSRTTVILSFHRRDPMGRATSRKSVFTPAMAVLALIVAAAYAAQDARPQRKGGDASQADSVDGEAPPRPAGVQTMKQIAR